MILQKFKDFPRVGRIIGIDWGARRTGIAITDADRMFVFARPLIVTPRGMSAASAIADMVAAERAVGIIIGLPLHGDGTDSQTTAAVRNFAAELDARCNIPICFIDESLTSHAAQESMGRVRVGELKEKLDSAAACVILENAIAIINRQ